MLELNKLYNMDCMQGMKEFPDGFFDLAIVDPPYGIGIDGQKKRVCGNPKLFFNTIVFVHEHFSDRTAKNAAGGKCIIPAIFPVQPAPHFKQTLSVCRPLR